MTHEERRVRPEHHIVHDYANLVSSGLLITDPVWNDKLLKIAPVNSHVWHAFYMNCRKMFEFFQYKPSGSYLRARQFLANDVKFMFKHWTRTVQQHMEIHIMHVGGDRVTRNIVWTSADDKLYLEDFQMAWATFLANLKHEHKELFKDEIDHRLDSEFRHCRSLGKEFIL